MIIPTTDPIAADLPVAEEPLYEIVGGQRLELPPMGAFPTQLASTLLLYLTPFVRENNLGRVQAEMH